MSASGAAPGRAIALRNAMTVDVEDYFHVEALADVARLTRDPDQLGFQLLRRMKGGAAKHDRHPAADR